MMEYTKLTQPHHDRFKLSDWSEEKWNLLLHEKLYVECRQHNGKFHEAKYLYRFYGGIVGARFYMGRVEARGLLVPNQHVAIEALYASGDPNDDHTFALEVILNAFVVFAKQRGVDSITFLQSAVQGLRQKQVNKALHREDGVLDKLEFPVEAFNEHKDKNDIVWRSGEAIIRILRVCYSFSHLHAIPLLLCTVSSATEPMPSGASHVEEEEQEATTLGTSQKRERHQLTTQPTLS